MEQKSKCDCNERVGTEINSQKLFAELKDFFETQVRNKIFDDITDYSKVWYLDGGMEKEVYKTTVKEYECKCCGCLWKFSYPEFPASGRITKVCRIL